jgi:NAD+ kinase
VIADGLRQSPLNIGDTITLTKSSKNLRLARLHSTPFADRLVAKFKLPVDGWRES